ncbi:MAG: hypothetical protein ABIC91_04770 [Nanoarchaeota archaeon]|nr:hypothetical protein [Nanoarchaeota archaeon]MBU1030688.1 hypothetical protein [Nanoarchaeota archaeon]MBU1849347.1 hypothetical protein [Nanoarchaeota archaeon]
MILTIIKQEEQPLMNRNKVEANLSFTATTPSRKDVQKDMAKQVKAELGLVMIKSIHSGFGRNIAEVKAYIYKNKKALENCEQKHIIKRHEETKTEATKEAEAKPEVPAEETPVEEKKEESSE